MTDRTELERQIAELQAKLAALDAEPDWEAWRPALDAFYIETKRDGCMGTTLDAYDKYFIRGLIAALPLAPLTCVPVAASQAPAPYTCKHRCERDALMDRIAELEARVPVAAWPEPKHEPEWIDWQGGECPVPAGTLVEVRWASEATSELENPDEYDWRHLGSKVDIIAYRILGASA